MNDTQSALERAIEKLGAVEVAPGKIAELIEGAWVIISPQSALKAARRRRSIITGILMPSWWLPGHNFAIRYTDGPEAGHVIAYETKASAKTGARARKVMAPSVITVDLETGAEVSA